jgi:hypothetical protein
VNTVTAGALIALLVVGYPLYELVTTGQLDSTSALVRGGVVAGCCAVGITAIVRLALSWEDAAERERVRKLDSLFSDMEGAMAEGTLTAEDDDTAPPA